MVLTDYIQSIPPETVIYLGCKAKEKGRNKSNGAGFIFIGHAKDAPLDEYGKETVVDVYPHTIDWPGTTVLINGMAHGNYWSWHEYDPSVPYYHKPYQSSEGSFENLLMAIARACIQDYRNDLAHAIKRIKPQDEMEFDDLVKVCRRKADLYFLKGSGVGEYMIQAIEDEAKILWKYPKARKMTGERRQRFISEKRGEMMRERVLSKARAKYAAIKGRSVNRELH